VTVAGLFPQSEPLLPDDLLSRLYKAMLTIRLLDERAIKLQRSGRIGFYVTASGEEAADIGTVAALDPTDWLFPAYRQIGCLLYRGYPLEKAIGQLFGTVQDETRGRQMPCHHSSREYHFMSLSSVIGTQIVHAAGAGLAAKIRGEQTVSVTYFGDGATSANDFHSALTFAGVYKTPTIFVCINNQYAISLPVHKQSGNPNLSEKAHGYGIVGQRVAGHDVQAVYMAMTQAVARARAGEGPTLLEILTYRRGPHSSSDDVTRYRSNDELAQWPDPITVTRDTLIGRGVWSPAEDEELIDTIQQQLTEAIQIAQSQSVPLPESLFEDVYEDMPPGLIQQRQALQNELAASDSRAVVEDFPL
jgi:pyruvate dehydrogenase E1 component alpha subunit